MPQYYTLHKPNMVCSSLPHIVIFPFMSKGHTIPLLHLAHLLHRRRLATLTLITTPLNSSFIHHSLAEAHTDANVLSLPFPDNIPGVLPGVESTDQLPSIHLFIPFVTATKQLRPHFEHALSSLGHVSLLISDGFLGWSRESASKFGIPRAVFFGMGNFAFTVAALVATHRPHAGVTSDDQPFGIPGFPNLKITKGDLNPPHDDPDPKGPAYDFNVEAAKQTMLSQALIVNSFYTLEAPYFDCYNKNFGPKGWCVGPLCLEKPKPEPELVGKIETMKWLDIRAAENRPVLYVAFGSQADVSEEQMKEIASGMETSGMDFLWVVRRKVFEGSEEFEQQVRERGKVVKEWVDQMEILRHKSVKGFLSHCGWNSVMESICCGVPMLAWPMLAEQPMNAKFVVDELGIGMRIRPRDGSKHGLVKGDDIEQLVRELLVGEKGKAAAERVKELAVEAEAAMMDDGPSASSLEEMIGELSQTRVALQDAH